MWKQTIVQQWLSWTNGCANLLHKSKQACMLFNIDQTEHKLYWCKKHTEIKSHPHSNLATYVLCTYTTAHSNRQALPSWLCVLHPLTDKQDSHPLLHHCSSSSLHSSHICALFWVCNVTTLHKLGSVPVSLLQNGNGNLLTPHWHF